MQFAQIAFSCADVTSFPLSIAMIGHPRAPWESAYGGFAYKQCVYYSRECGIGVHQRPVGATHTQKESAGVVFTLTELRMHIPGLSGTVVEVGAMSDVTPSYSDFERCGKHGDVQHFTVQSVIVVRMKLAVTTSALVERRLRLER